MRKILLAFTSTQCYNRIKEESKTVNAEHQPIAGNGICNPGTGRKIAGAGPTTHQRERPMVSTSAQAVRVPRTSMRIAGKTIPRDMAGRSRYAKPSVRTQMKQQSPDFFSGAGAARSGPRQTRQSGVSRRNHQQTKQGAVSNENRIQRSKRPFLQGSFGNEGPGSTARSTALTISTSSPSASTATSRRARSRSRRWASGSRTTT